MQHANSENEILDLGSGNGLIVNKIFNLVKSIDCIEYYKEFSKFIIEARNITIYNTSIWDFTPHKRYDLITAFRFMHYFNESEAIKIYKQCLIYLKNIRDCRGGGVKLL